MILPTHKNPSADRTASAPYNFVPLPEVVVSAAQNADELPNHDRYEANRHTGYFDVTLTTKSPVYVRCPLTLEQFERLERGDDEKAQSFRQQVKNTPDFFYTSDRNQPVIPGSSLRGMLRSVLEVVSYSKMQWVTDKKLFYRTVDDSAVGAYYNRRMVEELGDIHISPADSAAGYRARVEGGFLRFRSNGTCYIEECDIARVDVDDVLSAFSLHHRRELYELRGRELTPQNERNPNQTPKWAYQHKDVWAEVDPVEKDYFFPKQSRSGGGVRHPDLYMRFRRANNMVASEDPAKTQGVLVLTGHIEFKHLAFIFIRRDNSQGKNPSLIEVCNDPIEKDINKRLLDRFHDDDQITQWQSLAFPNGQPSGKRRGRDGHLSDGDPVFFLRENGQLTFFGRAQMFRLPYTRHPLDLVPKDLCRPETIDYAEALFGFVRTRQELDDMKARGIVAEIPKQGDKKRAYAGRVFVTDAPLTEGQGDVWLSAQPIVPQILASPKPTAFQHYLTQQEPNNPKQLDHYDSESHGNPPEARTVIRGYKRYWHQGLAPKSDLSFDDIKQRIAEDRQRLDEILRGEQRACKADTQHTHFIPVKPEVAFSFRVYFENLSDRELGALCWTLHPLGNLGTRYYHHIGMGKPLGMGSVQLDAKLYLTTRPMRYSALLNGDSWQTGAAGGGEHLSERPILERLTQAFEQHILGELKPNKKCIHLYELKRVGVLLKMMEWPGFPAELCPTPDNRFLKSQNRPNTRYMSVQIPDVPPRQRNEYRNRPVLPDPLAFGRLTGDAEPVLSGPIVKEKGAAEVPIARSPSPAPSSVRGSGPSTPSFSTLGDAFKSISEPDPREQRSRKSPPKDVVTLMEDAKRGKARVQNEAGEEFICIDLPPVGARQGRRCRIEVMPVTSKVPQARFKGWENV